MRCSGITKKFKRCGRCCNSKLFCHDHWFQLITFSITIIGILGSIASIYSLLDTPVALINEDVIFEPNYIDDFVLAKNSTCKETLGIARLGIDIENNHSLPYDSVSHIMKKIISKSNCFVLVNRKKIDEYIHYERALLKNRKENKRDIKLINADYFLNTKIVFRSVDNNDPYNYYVGAYQTLVDIRSGIELVTEEGFSNKFYLREITEFDKNVTTACLKGYQKMVSKLNEYANMEII